MRAPLVVWKCIFTGVRAPLVASLFAPSLFAPSLFAPSLFAPALVGFAALEATKASLFTVIPFLGFPKHRYLQ